MQPDTTAASSCVHVGSSWYHAQAVRSWHEWVVQHKPPADDCSRVYVPSCRCKWRWPTGQDHRPAAEQASSRWTRPGSLSPPRKRWRKHAGGAWNTGVHRGAMQRLPRCVPPCQSRATTPTLAQHAYRWQYRLMLRSAPHFATNFLGGSAVMMVDGHRCHCIIPSTRKLGLYQVIKSVMIKSPKLHSQTRTPNTKRRWTTLHATAFHCPCRVPETRARAVSP